MAEMEVMPERQTRVLSATAVMADHRDRHED